MVEPIVDLRAIINRLLVALSLTGSKTQNQSVD